jgi:hypothetical protein
MLRGSMPPPEEAVIEAPVEIDQEAERSEQVNDTANKILDALRTIGYEPALRIEDVEIQGAGPVPVWTPATPTDTLDTHAGGPGR